MGAIERIFKEEFAAAKARGISIGRVCGILEKTL